MADHPQHRTAPDPSAPTLDDRGGEALELGTRVEVRQRFDASWSRGFEVVDRTEEGYRLRRLSDGSELPAAFAPEEVRAEKTHGRSMWWY